MIFVNLTCETPNHSFIALFEQFSAPCPTRQQTAYSAIRSSCNRRSLRTPVCYCLQQNTQKRRDFRWLWLFLHRLLPRRHPLFFKKRLQQQPLLGSRHPRRQPLQYHSHAHPRHPRNARYPRLSMAK